MSAVEIIDRDLGWREIAKALRELGAPSVYVGVRQARGSRSYDGGEITLAGYATVNEFGSLDGRVPERSFLRSTVDENRTRYEDALAHVVELALDGKEWRREVNRLGLTAVGDVQRKIAAGIPPANAPSTVARKGSSTPLIDTGRLRQSIDFEVREERIP